MATNRNQTSIEGGLYDLVARGVKDTYFTKDDIKSINPFDWRYERYPASLPEFRWTNPLNDCRFGQRVEWEFDLPGDVLLEAHLVIQLPSWLPPDLAAYNPTSQTYVDGNPDKVYGYTNGVGYFLFERIQIFQDNLLIQEVSGDALYAAAFSKGSWNQSYLTQDLAGMHDGSPSSIMHNATPGILEIPIPMIGCSWEGDKGLPLCGLRQTVFRLRCQLRPLEKLVEGALGETCPTPWTYTYTQNRDGVPDVSNIPAIERILIGQPVIQLRTKQLYLANEVRHILAKETIEVPYIRYYENLFTLNSLDYAPLSVGTMTSSVTRVLDANFTVERILTYFRNSQTIGKNQLWNFTNTASSDGQFYNSIQLTIAGQLREGPWGPDVWERIVTDAKQERSPAQHIAIFDWSRGWRIEDVPPAIREPTGGINFTTADRPTFLLELKDVAVDPTLGYKLSYMTSLCETWGLYRIRNGKGGLEYAN